MSVSYTHLDVYKRQTKDQSDFVYTITVEGHGDYPTEKILTDPAIKVSGAATEESNNQWEYLSLIHI